MDRGARWAAVHGVTESRTQAEQLARQHGVRQQRGRDLAAPKPHPRRLLTACPIDDPELSFPARRITLLCRGKDHWALAMGAAGTLYLLGFLKMFTQKSEK